MFCSSSSFLIGRGRARAARLAEPGMSGGAGRLDLAWQAGGIDEGPHGAGLGPGAWPDQDLSATAMRGAVRTLQIIVIARMPTTTDNDTITGILITSIRIILVPMKTRITASP